MSQSILFNGTVYTIPDVGDDAWGQNVTDYFVAIPSGALQKSGGTFTLTADVNFGASKGLLSAYFSTRTALPSTAGLFRLAKTDSIGWRNTANGGNLLLAIDSSDNLTFNGNPIVPSTALTANRALVSSGTGLISVSAVTSTELGYVSGVTSAIQTQLDGKQLGPLTGDVTTSGAAATLATVNASVGSFGSSTAIPAFTVNAKGLITTASTNVVIAPAGTLTGTTLASNVVTSSLTAVGTIATGTWSATTIAVNKGGTGATSLTANNVILGNGTSAVQFVAPGSSGNVLQSSGGTWVSAAPAAATYTAPKITRYTSSTATHTITGSPVYVRFVAVGGGGGGGAGGPSGTGNSGTAGSNSTVASTLIVANGGALGVRANSGNTSSNYAAGGTGTVNSPAVTIKNITGGSGGGAGDGHSVSGVYAYGGAGGAGPLGGNGQVAGQNQQPGVAGIANTGGGGGGGSANSANGAGRYGGYGGAAGAYVEAQINAADLTATYAISVGAGGTGGTTADGDGAAGANGGSGYIEVIEYYQ